MSAALRAFPQAAVLRQPWQQRLGGRRWLRALATPLLVSVPPLLVAWQWGVRPAALLSIAGLVWLTWLWWLQVDGLLDQNRPLLARLVPGHATTLRRSLLLQWAVIGAAAFGLISLGLGFDLRWLWLALASMVTLAWLAREPWLWVLFGIGSPWLGEVGGLTAVAAALPAAQQVVGLLLLAVLLVACIGSGGRLHRWLAAHQRAMRQSVRAAAEGRPSPVASQGPLARALQRLFDWPLRQWRRRVLAASPAAPLLVRLDLGLDTGGRWAQLLWIGLMIAGLAVGVLTWVSLQHDQPPQQLIDAGRFGLCVGLYSMIAGSLHGRLGQLWARRREQALLRLLPGAPADGDATALERRWRREYLLMWGVATLLVLGVTAFGSPGAMNYAAACAAACLPLAWLTQHRQRRLQAPPRFTLASLVPVVAAVFAFLVQDQGVPAWLSLAAGALLYAACAWRHDALALRLPVGRAQPAA